MAYVKKIIMNYIILEIPFHRETKLRTLLSNQLNNVIDEFRQIVLRLGETINQSRIEQTLDFALAQDYGNEVLHRYYVTHPIRVAIFMIDWMRKKQVMSSEVIEACLIHNAIEKEILSSSDIKSKYGAWSARTIEVLTQDREALKDPIEKDKYYKRIYELDEYGQLLKFFDKLDNVYAICLNPSEQVRREYVSEIELYVRPIAVKYFPEVIPYFDELLRSSIEKGYYRPSYS